MNLNIIILAAGQGKRMKSDTPKVLHPIAGKPMIHHVLDCAKSLNPKGIYVIYGHGGDKLVSVLDQTDVHLVHQAEQLGTGHAVMQALPHLDDNDRVLVLSADVPLISNDTLNTLLHDTPVDALGLLTAIMQDPFGLGRIIRQDAQVVAIVEEKDASPAERAIKEIYSGICCAPVSMLKRWLPALGNHNAQGEYYLTEIIAMAVRDNIAVKATLCQHLYEIQGVNNREQLATLERIYQKLLATRLMHEGVSLADPSRIDIRGRLDASPDVFIDVNCVFKGHVILGRGVVIHPNCVIESATIGDFAEIMPHTVLEGCEIGKHTTVGPFARIRLGTKLGDDCKIGNFVETKKAVFAKGAKASHLSYIGDAIIGEKVNIGAGTITCNYDGVNKHQTIIESGAFIGSGTQLVAPVTVGENATIGAGTTLRKHAPADQLTLSWKEQRSIAGWKRPVKK